MANTALLDSTLIDVRRKSISSKLYLRMIDTGILGKDDKVELIAGNIVTITPINSKHSSVVKKISKNLIRNFSDKYSIGIQDPIYLSADSIPEPDVSILKYKEDFYNTKHPASEDILAIIEVANSSY